MADASEQAEHGTSTVELGPRANTSWRVLVVEDDLDTVRSMARTLKAMGHEVRFAIDVFAAIDIAREFRPDSILLGRLVA